MTQLNFIRRAGGAGLQDYGPQRSRYELADHSRYRLGGWKGQQGVERAMLGLEDQARGFSNFARDALTGPSAAQQAYFNSAQDATRRAQGDALSMDGVNPAAAAMMANRNANDFRLQAAGQNQIAQIQEQQARQAMAMQAMDSEAAARQAAGNFGAGLGDQGFQANLAQQQMNMDYDQQRMAAAQMYIQPEHEAMQAREQRKSDRRNMLIGGALSAAGAGLGGYMARP